MSALTTDDCKRKLVELYPATQAKSWKRTRKYLNTQKEWERVFECTQPGQTRTVVLLEQAGQLSQVTIGAAVLPAPAMPRPPAQRTQAPKPTLHALPSGLLTLAPTQDMNRLLFGASGPEPLGLPFATPYPQEMQFLLVLQNTIDWNAPEKARSCFDFAKTIDFKDFVARCTVQGIDVLGSFLIYMGHQIDYVAGLDEDNIVDAGASDYDDSLADVIDVLGRIRQAFVDNKWDAPLDRQLCKSVFQSAKFLKNVAEQTYSPDDEEAEEAFACIDTIMAMSARAPRV